MLAKEADIVVRFQGGANAGHTIVNNYGKFALHTLPSGVFYSHTTSVIGNGVALNIPVLIKELNEIVSKGVQAFAPPWKRTTMSASFASISVILPFPSSPQFAPTTALII